MLCDRTDAFRKQRVLIKILSFCEPVYPSAPLLDVSDAADHFDSFVSDRSAAAGRLSDFLSRRTPSDGRNGESGTGGTTPFARSPGSARFAPISTLARPG